VFSAKVSSADVVSDENLNWINGDCTNATAGKITCNFNSGIFTVSPNCTATPLTVDNNTTSVMIDTISSSQVILSTSRADAYQNIGIHLICQKQGADFKPQQTITGTFAEMVKAPGISKPKTCYYAFGGASATLASPTECASGTCVEVYDSCGTGTPPAFSATGTYLDITFASGTFALNSPISCSCSAFPTTSATGRRCNFYFVSGDSTWSSNSSGGAVLNFYTTDAAATASNSYAIIKCEGQAP
jgi:hypothetical protein